MISALAETGAALAEPRYMDAARTCAEFLLSEMRDEQGRLLRTYSQGPRPHRRRIWRTTRTCSRR